jgi:sugar phosphate isomerase/epimerase
MKLRSACFSIACTLSLTASGAARTDHGLWDHRNIVACVVNHFDAKARNPEETAQMFNRLGITKLSYNWREVDVANFDAEIDAMQKHHVQIVAWTLYGSGNAHTQLILDTFKRHRIRPQLWIEEAGQKRTAEEVHPAPEQQQQKVNDEADKVAVVAKLAAPYGVKVVLYNHNGWLGMEENQLAVIGRLKELGAPEVGMVYNFTHARDPLHDDSKEFATLWPKMQHYVVEVNITGMAMDGTVLYPSQGDAELDMMRVIQQSGWHGPIGITAEKGGDAEVNLRNYLLGVDWLAAELKKPGSGGARPAFASAQMAQ